MVRYKHAAALALTLGLLASCAGSPRIGGNPNLKVLPGTDLPPGKMSLAGQTAEYYVGPFDKLTIDVFGIQDLSHLTVQVDAHGYIRFPLVGEVVVAGKTPNEIAELLTRRLGVTYLRDPQIMVNLTEVGNQALTIEGEVEKPGLYPVVGRMTLMRAIALAGGTEEFAKLNDVVIFRTVDGQQMAAVYNLEDIRHGAYPDPNVYADDVISVGDDKARRILRDVLTGLPVVVLLDRLAR